MPLCICDWKRSWTHPFITYSLGGHFQIISRWLSFLRSLQNHFSILPELILPRCWSGRTFKRILCLHFWPRVFLTKATNENVSSRQISPKKRGQKSRTGSYGAISSAPACPHNGRSLEVPPIMSLSETRASLDTWSFLCFYFLPINAASQPTCHTELN